MKVEHARGCPSPYDYCTCQAPGTISERKHASPLEKYHAGYAAGRSSEREKILEYLEKFAIWVNQGPECADAVYEAKRHIKAIKTGEHLK